MGPSILSKRIHFAEETAKKHLNVSIKYYQVMLFFDIFLEFCASVDDVYVLIYQCVFAGVMFLK